MQILIKNSKVGNNCNKRKKIKASFNRIPSKELMACSYMKFAANYIRLNKNDDLDLSEWTLESIYSGCCEGSWYFI
jgi:hypothetical protein